MTLYQVTWYNNRGTWTTHTLYAKNGYPNEAAAVVDERMAHRLPGTTQAAIVVTHYAH